MDTPTLKQLTAAEQTILCQLAVMSPRTFRAGLSRSIDKLTNDGLITTFFMASRYGRCPSRWRCSITDKGRDVLFTATESTKSP